MRFDVDNIIKGTEAEEEAGEEAENIRVTAEGDNTKRKQKKINAARYCMLTQIKPIIVCYFPRHHVILHLIPKS